MLWEDVTKPCLMLIQQNIVYLAEWLSSTSLATRRNYKGTVCDLLSAAMSKHGSCFVCLLGKLVTKNSSSPLGFFCLIKAAWLEISFPTSVYSGIKMTPPSLLRLKHEFFRQNYVNQVQITPLKNWYLKICGGPYGKMLLNNPGLYIENRK